MVVETITNDQGYLTFRQNNEMAVLVLGTSWCHVCQKYIPTVESVALEFPEIAFGKVNLDTGHLIRLKRDFVTALKRDEIPVTVLLSQRKSLGYFTGLPEYEDLKQVIQICFFSQDELS